MHDENDVNHFRDMGFFNDEDDPRVRQPEEHPVKCQENVVNYVIEFVRENPNMKKKELTLKHTDPSSRSGIGLPQELSRYFESIITEMNEKEVPGVKLKKSSEDPKNDYNLSDLHEMFQTFLQLLKVGSIEQLPVLARNDGRKYENQDKIKYDPSSATGD